MSHSARPEFKDWYLSYLRSIARRDRWKRHQKMERTLFVPFVLGGAILVWYVTRSYPVEYWLIGALGILLMLPFLVTHYERID